MNHQEARDMLIKLHLSERELNATKVEVFRCSWDGKAYEDIAGETNYDHDYLRKAGSELWRDLSKTLNATITKRNFKPLLEKKLASKYFTEVSAAPTPGGAMPLNSPFYIEDTATEKVIINELNKPGGLVRVRGPKKMGKTSLIARVCQKMNQEGFSLLRIDLKKADREILENLDLLMKWFSSQLVEQSLLGKEFKKWDNIIGSKMNCSRYLEEVVSGLSAPVLIVIEELDLVFDCEDVATDFLSLIRAWYEEVRVNTNMREVRFILSYSSEVYVNIDINMSPFNVGRLVALRRFANNEIEALATAYGVNWTYEPTSRNPISRISRELGGHPYLTHLLIHAVAEGDIPNSPTEKLSKVLSKSCESGGLFDEYLTSLIMKIYKHNLVDALKSIHLGKARQAFTKSEVYKLESLSLVDMDKGEAFIPSGIIHDAIFNRLG